jgi:hypothetical protein
VCTLRNPVLYPTELRGHRAQAIVLLSSKLVASLLSSFLKTGQIFSLIGMIHLNLFLRRQSFCVATILAVLISGCVASDSPLSISLYNPKTGVQRTCSAKESSSSSKDVLALSSAVETCAKQLEARGFVRSNNH